MRGNSLERRVAAWVLTLPGPFAACTYEEAASEARYGFDPNAPQDAFETALHHWGYAIRRKHTGQFSIAQDSEAASLSSSLR